MVNIAGKIEYPKRKKEKKKNLDPYLTHHKHKKINSSWIVDQNVKKNTISS